MADEISMSYVGRAKCGCIQIAIVDNPEHIRDVAKEVGKAIRLGYHVERVTSSWVREHWQCYECEGKRIMKETLRRML